MSLSQAYSYILCKLHVQPIKTAEVAFFHLHFFHWRHIQWFFSLTYTDSAFFLLKNKKKSLKKGWKLRELWAKNCRVSTILEQTLIRVPIVILIKTIIFNDRNFHSRHLQLSRLFMNNSLTMKICLIRIYIEVLNDHIWWNKSFKIKAQYFLFC